MRGRSAVRSVEPQACDRKDGAAVVGLGTQSGVVTSRASGSRAGPAQQAPLVAPNAAALLRRNAADADIGGVRPSASGWVWTHREYLAESVRFANLFLERLPAGAPPHVAVLLDNTPDYLFAFGGAALIGGAIVGLNHTRRGEHLLRDAEHTHCGLVITEPRTRRCSRRSPPACRRSSRRPASPTPADPPRRSGSSLAARSTA